MAEKNENKTESKAVTTAVTPVQTAKPRTPMQVLADQHKGPWVICKNGNFIALRKDRAGAIKGLKEVSGFDAPHYEKTDGSIMLSGVGHYRTKPVNID